MPLALHTGKTLTRNALWVKFRKERTVQVSSLPGHEPNRQCLDWCSCLPIVVSMTQALSCYVWKWALSCCVWKWGFRVTEVENGGKREWFGFSWDSIANVHFIPQICKRTLYSPNISPKKKTIKQNLCLPLDHRIQLLLSLPPAMGVY